jgi:hypothetical protein
LSLRIELKMPLASAPKSSRAGRSSHVIGRSSKRTWLMSRRATPLLVEDIWEAIEKIQRYVAGLDHDTFIKDDKEHRLCRTQSGNHRRSCQPPAGEFQSPAPRDRVAQNHRPEKSHRSRLFQHRCRDCLGDHPEGFAEPQVEAFAHPRVTATGCSFPRFRNSRNMIEGARGRG